MLPFLCVLLAAVLCLALGDQTIRGDGFVFYCYDNSTGSCTGDPSGLPAPEPLQVLMGGGADVDDAFSAMIARSGGGHFVILRSDDDDGYNEYVWQLGGNGTTVLSVTSLVVFSRDGAAEPIILQRLQQAAAVFVAGGYQNEYMTFWNNTELQTVLQAKVGKVPLGGTSAGAMVQPQYIYTSLGGMAVSDQVLENPYDVNITLGTLFINNPFLADVIVDTHFYQRDRFGRTMTFMARVLTDYPPSETNGGQLRGVACSEQSAVVVVPSSGIASVLNETPGPEHACYFFYADSSNKRICQPNTPLTFANITIFRASSKDWEGGEFDMIAWKPIPGSGGSAYTVSAVNGNLTSTQSNGQWY
jgi:cyanophycinase